MPNTKSHAASTSVLRFALMALAAVWALQAPAQSTADTAQKRPRAAAAATRAQPPRPAASAPAVDAVAASRGYRIGPRPAWVVEPPAPPQAQPAPATSGASARRELLIDEQVNYALPKVQASYRLRSMAIDASMLGTVSQPQIRFNPAYQTVVIHEAVVVRGGARVDRLRDARIEVMRRETQLDRQIIDGAQTLLVVLPDVQVGEAVEVSFTIEGSNPIFEGRVSVTFHTASESPIDLLHQRVIAPAERALQVRSIAGDLQPERSVEGSRQVLRLVRTQLPALVPEAATPPWFKVYPAWQVSEFASWSEVDRWAQGLFRPAGVAGPGVRAQAEALRATGLKDEALVSEALRFVQDEVRYFSVSLGENSHRPKAAEATLAERLGDCKDKVVLLNALLAELGFVAQPALTSLQRNRGVAAYLPSVDQFDHVISRVVVNSQPWFLDPTINGQGTTLASRGRFPYGQVLVVGAGESLTPVPEAQGALSQTDHEQHWDFSRTGGPVGMKSVLRASGLMAERWRAGVAQFGLDRVVESMAGAHARVVPGIRMVGTPTVKDDRTSNTLDLTIEFEHPFMGTYSMGALEVELSAVELFDVLVGPPEARRRMPFMIDQPRVVTSRMEVLLPRAMPAGAPPPAEVSDRHFRFTQRVQVDGVRVAFERRYERRGDEVLPQDMPTFRDNLNKARQMTGTRLRMGLVDTQALRSEFEQIDRRMRTELGTRNDQLSRIVLRNHVSRALDEVVSRAADAGSPLRAIALASRASAGNLVGDFTGSLADADKALQIQPDNEDALEARAVALVGLGRSDQSMEVFRRLQSSSRRIGMTKWMGAVELHRGRPAEAEALLREVVAGGSGDDRDFALLWLYLAAEQQGGRGKAAIAPYVDTADTAKLAGTLLHFLDGRIDREALLRKAREDAAMERLNLAEAYFFIGQQLAARGQKDEAMRWYERTVSTQALPYREVTFARLELQRPR